MALESVVDRGVKEKISDSKKLLKLYSSLCSDPELKALVEQTNKVLVTRLGFNDHGVMHSKITADSALKILTHLTKAGIRPNIVKEKVGTLEDAKAVLLIAAFIHDIGNAFNRKAHEESALVIGLPIVRRILAELYSEEKLAKLLCYIGEAVICHMGEFPASSIEAGIISIADGTDLTKGRARIPFRIKPAARGIHAYSAIAIDRVDIKAGRKKPVRIEVDMSSSAGVFQVEETLLKKIKNSGLDKHIEVVSLIKEKGRHYKDIYL